MAAETPVGVQSVGRAFHLLHLMSEAGGQMSISALAAASGLPLPTIHRIIRTLTESGYVRQDASRQYTLGPRLVGLGESASRMLAAGAQPDLRELAEVAGETANMALYDGDRAVYVAQVPSHHSMRMYTEVGRRVHLHATGVGKALLSQMSDSAVGKLMTSTGMPPLTDRTITDVNVLLQVLAEIRERGHTVDDGEHEVGVRCVAVPVPEAPTLTAISVSGPESRLTADVVDRVVPLLRETATAVAKHFA